MSPLAKNLLAGLLVGSTALVGSVVAGGEEGMKKHRLIEVKARKDQDITIAVDNDGSLVTKIFTAEQLKDSDYIDAELADLDDDTQDLIRQALEGVSHTMSADFNPIQLHGDGKHKVIVVNGGEGKVVNVSGYGDVDYDFNVLQDDGNGLVEKHIIIGDSQKVLRGHTPAIVKMIERGEFTQNELDQIQVALDAKR